MKGRNNARCNVAADLFNPERERLMSLFAGLYFAVSSRPYKIATQFNRNDICKIH
jgi:hypothetical protein